MKCLSLVCFFITGVLLAACNFEKKEDSIVKESKQDEKAISEEVTMEEEYEPQGIPASCMFVKTKYTPSNKFPFSKASRIELLSYQVRTSAPGSNHYPSIQDTLIINGKFAVENIKEKIILNQAQIDSLFSILYNFPSDTTTYRPGTFLVADCYNPRHAIVFYNGNKAISYIEICFECDGYAIYPKQELGDFCSDKLCYIMDFLIWSGIKQGIIREACH